MRLLIAAALAAISTGAAADRCASPGGPSPLIPSLPSVQLVSVPAGGCLPPAVQVAEAAVCTDGEGGPMMVWDGDAPRCLTAAESLGLARDGCLATARTSRSAAINAVLLPDEQVLARTEPVTPGYESRKQWWDHIVVLYDAYVGPAGPVATAATVEQLEPCPPLAFPTFEAWEATQ